MLVEFSYDTDFKEEQHPRDHGGKFTKGSGGGGTKAEEKPSTKGKIPSRERQQKSISGLTNFLGVVKNMAQGHYANKGMISPADFILRNGNPYIVNKKTYSGKRDTPQECYRNAALDALNNPDHTYVEGYVSVHGVPIEHAWTVDKSGQVYDSTIEPDENIDGYFGVPVDTNYLSKSLLQNKTYGLLSGFGKKALGPLLKGESKDFRASTIDIHDSLARETKEDTTQPVKDVDELYEKAKAEEPSFKSDVETVADSLPGSSVVYTPPEFAEPGTVLKSMGSAKRKLRDELGGDASQLRDVLRATIVNPTVEGTREAAARFIEKYGDRVLRVKDRFVQSLGGYRDILVNYRTENGLVAEVQFNSKNLLDAKFGEGHKIYEKIRAINANKSLTPADETQLRELETNQRKLYEEAYQNDGNGNWGKKHS